MEKYAEIINAYVNYFACHLLKSIDNAKIKLYFEDVYSSATALSIVFRKKPLNKGVARGWGLENRPKIDQFFEGKVMWCGLWM